MLLDLFCSVASCNKMEREQMERTERKHIIKQRKNVRYQGRLKQKEAEKSSNQPEKIKR
jgi:hypothetical protein